MGISLDSLSITSAFNSIVNFFKSQENNSRWKDLTAGAEGTFLIRMLANIVSNISYRLVTARRENYISTANLKSSVLGIALNLGYSAHRGTNQKRTIRFEPNSDYVIPPFSVIGTYNDNYDVIYVGEKDEETHLRKGLILEGPYEIAIVSAMNPLTRTITLNVDVSNDLSIGDTILIEGTEVADGRYTVASITVRQVNANDKNSYVIVEETIPSVYNSNGTTNARATRIGIQEFNTVIGKIKTITWTAGTSKTQPFTRFEEGISEDYVLYLDGEEVPTSNVVKDLNEDCYLVRTNPYSSVDVLYMNHIATNTHRYGTESNFTLKYIELADVDTEDYSPTMSGYGTLTDTTTIDEYVPFESNEDIKINAPIDHGVQHLIRSKVDFSRRVRQYFPNVLEVTYQAVTPTYTLLTYLKDDCTTIQQSDFDSLSNVLENERYFGTPLPDYTHPVRETVNLIIQIYVTDKMKDSNDIRYDISNIIKTNYSKMLAQKFDTYALERLIEQLSYVKWARVSYDIGEWLSRGLTDLGTIIYANDTYYKASKILGVSGGIKPAWNIPTDMETSSIALDGIYETEDGNVIWRTYKRLDVDSITEHSTGTKYAIGDYVYDAKYPNYMFKCVDLIKSSGATATIDVTTVEQGNFIADGELILVCKEYSSYYPARQASTSYRLGSSFNVGAKSFEVVSYIGKTGYLSPSFEKAYYDIADTITPKTILNFTIGDNNYFQIVGDYRQYFETNSVVVAETDRGFQKEFTVKSVRLTDDNKTNIYINEEIDTPQTEVQSYGSATGIGSVFITERSTTKGELVTDKYKVGDYIKAVGTLEGGKNRTDKFSIIEIKEIKSDTGEDRVAIYVKGILPSGVDYTKLIAAGYTLISSADNNSFVIDGNVTSYFPAGSIIKSKSDEDTITNYLVTKAQYVANFNQTYIRVSQEISNHTNYLKLAPAWNGTEDGEIVWKIVDDPTTIKYNWNAYNDISYKVNIQH